MNRNLIVRFYNDSDRQAWDSYVLNHSRGTFFHLIGWKEIVEVTFHHKSFYLIAVRNESPTDIVGVLPLFRIKSLLFGKSLVSVPFAEIGGILASDQETKSLLLEEAKNLTHSESVDYLELRNQEKGFEDLPAKDLYVGFEREIFKDLDANMEAIPRKSRRMVRVGEKEGLTHEFGMNGPVSTFYKIFAQSYHRLGSPVFPKRLFENLLKVFKDQANILIVRTKEGIPIAGVLSFFFKETVLPYYAGSLSEYRSLAPNDYMYWQLLKYGWERGYKVFNFGRSKVGTGSYDFKRHWGFEPTPLPDQYFLNGIPDVPNISPANPKYQRRIEMWRKLPLWATKLIGPRIVKYIP